MTILDLKGNRKMKYMTEERETHLHYDLIDREWSAYTNIPEHMRKLEAKGWKKIRVGVDEDGEVIEAFYKAPKNAITFRDLNKPKRSGNAAFLRQKSAEQDADE